MRRSGARLYSLGLGAAIPVWASLAMLGETAFNPLQALSGRWEARDPRLGRAGADCEVHWYEYRISADSKRVELVQHRDGQTRHERYHVLTVQNDRVLLVTEGERRLTEYGGPVTWWAVFDGRNRFRLRRDDWPGNSVTALEWRRCW